MKKLAIILTAILVFTMVFALSAPAFAEEDGAPEDMPAAYAANDAGAEDAAAPSDATASKAVSAAVLVAVAAATGAVAMAIAISKSTDAMARQPEMAGKINSAMMLGLVFIETAIIYALIVAILIIFVL